MGHWEKFCLLMWKNWKLQIRKPIAFAVEIGIPLLIAAVLLFLRSKASTDKINEQSDGPDDLSLMDETLLLAYVPNTNTHVKSLMEKYKHSPKGFGTEDKMKDFLIQNNGTGICGVVFDLPSNNFTGNINIKIRYKTSYSSEWKTDSLYPDFSIDRHYNMQGPTYMAFSRMMFSLSTKIFQYNKLTTFPKEMSTQPFPIAAYVYDSLLITMGGNFFFGFLFMAAFAYSCTSTVKSITLEKEKQLKESMKIMGLPTWLHWTAWFVQIITPLLVVVIVMAVTMKLPMSGNKLLKYSDGSLLFVFFLLFVVQTITFSFAISVFFSKANRAASLAGMIWILAMVPYIIIRSGSYMKIGSFIKYFTAFLLSPSAVSYGFDVIVVFESRDLGAQWSNLFEILPENKMSFGGILLVMFFDIFFNILVMLYVEKIYPGEFGVAEKWYFLFTREFWSGKKSVSYNGRQSTIKGEFFEDEPLNLRAGIKINNLSKTFGANDAVKGVSMNLYEDQITVLLGHNGAGKTTTMSMLTGMFSPTSGTANINGYDIRTQIMNVRDSMGLCLQHNVLFDDLTVYEHLTFFSKLKGCSGSEVEEDVQKYLKLLNLEDKANSKSSELSGGMKRKLSVGIALCGNSKVIMLDEPTAGMDPSARRFIWEFLQQHKKGRTILLTTHFMDEADLLGDRIAIMSGGELKCCGSSFFLKKKYGAGYHLIIDQLPNCQPNAITRMLADFIPEIYIESNAGTELTYLLPEKHSSKFPILLRELEENSTNLGIRSFGISLTDLEEVFMKVGTNETGKMISKETDNYTVEGYTNVTISKTYLETGASLHKNQIKAILMKKYLVTIRSWITEVLKTLLPILYIILVLFTASSSYNSKDQGSRSFTLSDYDAPITLISGEKADYISLLQSLNQKYEESGNISATALKKGEEDPDLLKYKYIIGASITPSNPIAWYSDKPYHAQPLSLQMLINSYAKKNNFQLNFINSPIPKQKTAEDQRIDDIVKSMNSLMAIALSTAYIGSFYVMFNIKERVCQSKHLQFVSGINVFTFWMVSFVADLITYLIPAIAIVITFSILQPHGLDSFKSLGYLSLLLFDFGFVIMPFMYLFSYVFTVPSTGYSRTWFVSFAAGFPAVFILWLLQSLGSNYAFLKWILRIFPHYIITEGVFNLVNPSLMGKDTGDVMNFGENGLGIGIIYTYITAFIFFCLIFSVDLKVLSNLKYMIMPDKKAPSRPHNVDQDVQAENENVHITPLQQLLDRNVLVLKDLTKNYKNFTAVNGLNLTVRPSECFGLLGVNGAGKTTTFKMMTGDEMISHGNGWINGFSIKDQMKEVQRCIGYCPQFDALLDNLTARETLKIFCLIRGIPSEDCNLTSERLAKDFDFTQHLDKEVKQLSGGNKRKLSTAIALIGDAPILFLDEPTTGMDPGTKRHLWNRLSSIRERGKSIILTSHSMEECEALCTRLVIMVNGNFQCLGSVQHLKSRFSEGFSITLKIKKSQNSSGMEHRDTTAIENFMSRTFIGSELREKHQELLNYYVKDKNAKWSTLFGILERAKGELDIEDYSIGQASLEQVFLTFTKDQKSEDEPKKKKKRCCLCC